jgi:hypothetical protein
MRVDEVTDEPLYRDRVCGIDIGKAGMAATIRVPSDRDPSRRASETRELVTTRREVPGAGGLAAVLAGAGGGDGGDQGLLEAGVLRLEAEGFECVLADARQVKNLPGRPKRDPSHSRWLAACFAGLGHRLLRGHPGIPRHPGAHLLPAGPDRRADQGQAAGGEAQDPGAGAGL